MLLYLRGVAGRALLPHVPGRAWVCTLWAWRSAAACGQAWIRSRRAPTALLPARLFLLSGSFLPAGMGGSHAVLPCSDFCLSCLCRDGSIHTTTCTCHSLPFCMPVLLCCSGTCRSASLTATLSPSFALLAFSIPGSAFFTQLRLQVDVTDRASIQRQQPRFYAIPACAGMRRTVYAFLPCTHAVSAHPGGRAIE